VATCFFGLTLESPRGRRHPHWDRRGSTLPGGWGRPQLPRQRLAERWWTMQPTRPRMPGNAAA